MSNPYSPETSVAPRRTSVFGLHPLIATAAVAIIAVCGVGIATMLMNRTDAVPPQTTAVAPPISTPQPAPIAALPDLSAPQAAASEEPIPRPAAKPAAKPASKPVQKPKTYSQVAVANSEPSAPEYNPPPPPPPAICRECGRVESTREIKVAGQGSGLGAIAGGVVGGLLGHGVGEGRGKTAATLLGAVGGGFAGNAIEKSTKAGVQYQLTVRFEDGTTQTFTAAHPWPYGSGDRVRVVNGQVEGS